MHIVSAGGDAHIKALATLFERGAVFSPNLSLGEIYDSPHQGIDARVDSIRAG